MGVASFTPDLISARYHFAPPRGKAKLGARTYNVINSDTYFGTILACRAALDQAQTERIERIVFGSVRVESVTALGSYPQWAMQSAHFGFPLARP